MNIPGDSSGKSSRWPIYIMAFCAGNAMGIINPLVSTHMERNDIGSFLIGLNSTIFFLFMALGSVLVDKKMRKQDLKNIILQGLLLASLCAFFIPLTSNYITWCVLRAAMGIGAGFYFMGTQNILQNDSDSASRSIVSGLYTFFFAVGFVFGTFASPGIYLKSPLFAFGAAAFILMIAFVIIFIWLKGSPNQGKETGKKVFYKITMPLHAIFACGFAEAALVSLYPVFLLKHNYMIGQMDLLLGVFVLGSIIGTIPFSYLADKIGRKKILALCTAIIVIFASAMIFSNNYYLTLILSLMTGIGIGPVYPVSLSLTVEKLTRDEMPSGTSLFTIANSIGATAGPFISSIVMEKFGNQYVFSVCILIFIVLFFRIAFNKKRVFAI